MLLYCEEEKDCFLHKRLRDEEMKDRGSDFFREKLIITERVRERREKKPNEEEAEEESSSSSSMELWRIQLQKIPHLLEARIFCLLAMIPVGCCGRRSRPYWNTIKSKARVRGDHLCSCSKKEFTSRSRSIPRTIHRPCSTSFSWVKEEENFRLFFFCSLWLFQEEESS